MRHARLWREFEARGCYAVSNLHRKMFPIMNFGVWIPLIPIPWHSIRHYYDKFPDVAVSVSSSILLVPFITHIHNKYNKQSWIKRICNWKLMIILTLTNSNSHKLCVVFIWSKMCHMMNMNPVRRCSMQAGSHTNKRLHVNHDGRPNTVSALPE